MRLRGKNLCRTLWERGQVLGLNLHNLQEGPLSKAKLENVANADIQRTFLTRLEKPGGSKYEKQDIKLCTQYEHNCSQISKYK